MTEDTEDSAKDTKGTKGTKGLLHIALIFVCIVLEIGAGREVIRRALGKPTDLPSIMMLPLVLGVLAHVIHWAITGNLAFTYYRERLVKAQTLATRFVWAYFGIWATSALLAFFSS